MNVGLVNINNALTGGDGALKAAKFLILQKNGLYNMKNLID